jgi:hypothetical protein
MPFNKEWPDALACSSSMQRMKILPRCFQSNRYALLSRQIIRVRGEKENENRRVRLSIMKNFLRLYENFYIKDVKLRILRLLFIFLLFPTRTSTRLVTSWQEDHVRLLISQLSTVVFLEIERKFYSFTFFFLSRYYIFFLRYFLEWIRSVLYLKYLIDLRSMLLGQKANIHL